MLRSPTSRDILRRLTHARQSHSPRFRYESTKSTSQSSQPLVKPAPSKLVAADNATPTPGITPSPPTKISVGASPIWSRLGPLSWAAGAYGRAQRRRPWVTQICTSLVIYFFADISAQQLSRKDYDAARTGRSLVIGSIASVPAYEWFVWLSMSFNYKSKLLSLGTKIVVSQLVFTPVFGTYFFGMQALLAGDSWQNISDRIVTAVPIQFINAWKVWPIVLAFNFTYVPLEYRSAVAGVFAVGWQTYLAYLNRQTEDAEAARKQLQQ